MKINDKKFVLYSAIDNKKMIGLEQSPIKWNNKVIIFSNGYCTSFYSTNRIQKRWAQNLVDYGYKTIRYDYRGYGESEGEFIDTNLTSQIQDLASIIKQIDNKNIKEIILIGISLGGLITKLFSDNNINPKIKKCILLCPALDFNNIYNNGYKQKIVTTLFNWKDEIYVNNFEKDLFKYKDNINISNQNIEHLIIHGNKDNIIPLEGSKNFSKIHKNVTLSIIEDADHNFWNYKIDEKHYQNSLIINQKILRKILNFIKKTS